MQENRLQLDIVKQIETPKEQSIWQKKMDKFFNAIEYIHSSDLAQSHINKLCCVGVNSLSQTASFIQQSTQDSMHIINVQLESITHKLNAVAKLIDLFDHELSAKTGFFSKKKTDFFTFFQEKQPLFQKAIEELTYEQQTLTQCNKKVEMLMTQLFECYALLDRDISFLKRTMDYFKQCQNQYVLDVYHENELEISKIYTDLMTQQQLLIQKYASLQILSKNVNVFSHNVQYVTQISSGCLHNLIDNTQLAKMNPTGETLTQTQSFISKINATVTQLIKTPFQMINN